MTEVARFFEISTRDVRTTRVVDEPAPVLAGGDVLLRINEFGMSSNNVTYALSGDAAGYWQFFPAEPGWGRVPAWGYATVADSGDPALQPGERLFGLLPMGTHLVVRPAFGAGPAVLDISPHRLEMAPAYNRYVRGVDGVAAVVFRPLFATAFAVSDWLKDTHADCEMVVVTSASSKTSLCIAHQLRHSPERRVYGLTSPPHLRFVAASGLYSSVGDYASVDDLPLENAVVIDVAGDASILRAIHQRLGDKLAASRLLGATHWEQVAPTVDLPGPAPEIFFAPAEIARMRGTLGSKTFDEQLDSGWRAFTEWAENHITIQRKSDLASLWRDLVAGTADPHQAMIAVPPGAPVA